CEFSGGPPAPERPTFKPPPPSSTQVRSWSSPGAFQFLNLKTWSWSWSVLLQDGAFIVRDSSRQSAVQPYTLMVQYQNKVYNIQIQNQDRKYLLGTGIKSFLSVREIVEHFSQSPLLLIDSKNRGSSQQNQCLLSVPAGPYVDRV
uniref:SH2 domain-containing protein n=1 Tax=Periophthalmus magnuspinnatus TaxID=409849 RepID=A0A3B3ZB67_9GOBI